MSSGLNSIKLSRVARRQSRRRHKSIKTSQSSRVIHVSIRNAPSISNKSFHQISLSKYQKKHVSPVTPNSNDKTVNTIVSSISQNTWDFRNLPTVLNKKESSILNLKKTLSIQQEKTGVVQDHHQKKKTNKKCRRIFLCVCLVATLLIAIAIAIILAILLSKKSTTKVTPSLNPTLRWNSTGITILGATGIMGTNSSLLYWPYGLAFDSSNTLYVADYLNHRVQKLITGTSTAVTAAANGNGIGGTAMNQLQLPVHMYFDSNDNMYITDRGNNRIQLYTKGATSGSTVAGINGTLNISLSGPSAIVIDSSPGILYFTDTYNHRIISYPAGAVVAGGNGQGNSATTLNYPYGSTYESVTKSLIIPNYSSNNIVRWIPGATNRTYIAGDVMGNPGSNSTFLDGPVGITMDPMGNIYVADSNNNRSQLFMAGQTTATTIAGMGTNATQLNSPYWVILDNQLNLYVSDTVNNRVQKYLRY